MAEIAGNSRLGNMWANLTPSQRMMIAGTAVAVVVVIIVGGVLASRAGYSTLYSGLSPEEAGLVVQELDTKKIPYRITGGGSSIQVPTSQVYSARISLASEGFPRSGSVGFEIFDGNLFGMTDFLQKINYRRALEGELAKTISQMQEVDGVRVHIVIPERPLFKEDEQPATASVVIKGNPARSLSSRQIEGIAYLVASSVEGLEPNRVTILDSRGTLMSRGFPDGDGEPGNQLELAQSVETYLEGKAQTLLDEVLGPGRSVVRVSAVLNFRRIESSTETYDPETAVVRSEERIETTKGESGDRSETSVTNYEMGRTVESIANEVGNLEKLSVAVMVDGKYEEGTDQYGEVTRTFVPRTADELQTLAGIVRSAVGVDDRRGDYFEIATIAFDRTYLEEQERGMEKFMKMQFYMSIAKKGIYAVAIFFAIFMVIKLVKKAARVIEEASKALPQAAPRLQHQMPAAAQSGSEKAARAAAPATAGSGLNYALENPKETASLIKSMMEEGE
jgi:flagellar M-ring protein FliF